MSARSADETLAQLTNTLNALKIGIDAYVDGRIEGWMIVSCYLHQLLTDTSPRGKNEPLAMRVFPNLRLHPIKEDYAKITDWWTEQGLIMGAAGPGVWFDDGIPAIMPDHIFNLQASPVPVSEWLSQGIFVSRSKVQTIKKVILVSRDNLGGGHYDPSINEMIIDIESHAILVNRQEQYQIFIHYVVEIGSYIYSELMSELIGSLGRGLINDREFEKAELYLSNALRIKQETGSLFGQIAQLNNLARLWLDTHQYSNALTVLTHAFELATQIGDLELQDGLDNNIYMAHSRLGLQEFNSRNFPLALQSFREALFRINRLHKINDEIIIIRLLSLVYAAMNEIDNAIFCLFLGVVIFQENRSMLDEQQSQYLECIFDLWQYSKRTPRFMEVVESVYESATEQSLHILGFSYKIPPNISPSFIKEFLIRQFAIYDAP